MSDYSEFVPNVHFELIPIKSLVSNQEYQRNLSRYHIKRTAENFDPYQINPVKVSRREGINYVFNGQHTIEIVATVSGSRDTPVWCMVYDDMDYITEADVFANQQKFIKALSPYEIFVANLEAENEEQLTIQSLVESYGLKIANQEIPGCIRGVSSLEYIYENYGFHVLDRTLSLCVATWEGEKKSLSSNILKGIAKLIVAYGDSLNDELFKEKVGAFSAKEICRTAKERKGGALGYAEAMLICYNKKMRGGLKWNKLYANRKKMPDDYDYMEDYDETEEKASETQERDEE